jgi:hypothetical protein
MAEEKKAVSSRGMDPAVERSAVRVAAAVKMLREDITFSCSIVALCGELICEECAVETLDTFANTVIAAMDTLRVNAYTAMLRVQEVRPKENMPGPLPPAAEAVEALASLLYKDLDRIMGEKKEGAEALMLLRALRSLERIFEEVKNP